MKKQKYFVYILACENGAYYTGYTTDLERRFQEHTQGTAKCKFTRSFKPIAIAQSWQVRSKTKAMQLEYFIKTLSKLDKETLIRSPKSLQKSYNSLKCLRHIAI